MLFGLDIKAWLGLSVLGAFVSTLGALAGIILKEYFFARSLERWRQRQTLEQVYQRFRDPLVLSARELASRTLEIVDQYPTVYLRKAVLATRPQSQVANDINDPYFQKYKLLSTAYRLSAFLGWLELYRQEITFLRPGNSERAQALEVAVGQIRCDLADGQINAADDWCKWRDTLIFREELRAIGESVLETCGSSRHVMGYGRYCEHLESGSPSAVQRWSPVVMNFYLDLETTGHDFRRVRLERMLIHLVDLVALLDKSAVEPRLRDAYLRLQHAQRTARKSESPGVSAS